MKVTYDSEADAAYIYLKSEIAQGEVKKTYCCDVKEVGGMIALDFDGDGCLLGIEILGAESKLPQEFINSVKSLHKGKGEER